MIEDFPFLKDGEVALIRARLATGHVVDETFQLAISASQKVFTVYSNVDEALRSANRIVKEHLDIEVVLYGKDKTVLL